MTPIVPTRSLTSPQSTRLLRLLIVVLLFTGCASATKLARKSQEQLAKGEIQASYETALKAVKKDPYLEPARTALGNAGSALLSSEMDRLRSMVQVDTVQAAEVAIRIADIRSECAPYGVSLPIDSLAWAEQRAARAGAARVYATLGDEQWETGHPKAAYEYYLDAKRFNPDHPRIDARLETSYRAAEDVVLVLPVQSDLRMWVDREALSRQWYREARQVAEEGLTFTRLKFPEEVWFGVPAGFAAPETRGEAIHMAREAGASRVLWVRLYGDRVDTHVDHYHGILYYEGEEGSDSDSKEWGSEPFHVQIEDLWTSVAVACEILDLSDERVVASRSTELGAGLRTIVSTSEFEHDGDEYALCTPEMDEEDDDRCDDLEDQWEELLGDVSIEDLVDLAEYEPRRVDLGRSQRCGTVYRNGRRHSIYYGTAPVESQLVYNAVSRSWGSLADVLRESDAR